ncbi:2-dehydro-3-deoxygalactonokinase [Pseudohoeflea coraliihabitans]|uniref:2-dehydro-3-deoxygalactonokinase n=1 Tax=Pseudohoeflea coraliihabitans TaxID=2860393 RepID=A0ABS6WN39_9HYPH|nr:2-dehydro-3-deoxygalactonokinase [Pseudohoeflea sp. DP4N28-3]MBW3097083.1 2-dehydro-3-deoxygalactonokinase [Pseudohoeflea sp. DP4N28-3]
MGPAASVAAVALERWRQRIWVLSRDGTILAEMVSDPPDDLDALNLRLAQMHVPADLPAIICGEAGGSQHLPDAGYQDLPLTLAALAAAHLEVRAGDRQILLLPGVARHSDDEPDLLDGQATALLGAALEGGGELYCLPGSPCAWATVSGASLMQFRSYATQDLVHGLASHRRLQGAGASTQPEAIAAPEAARAPAFLTGVRDGFLAPERLTHLIQGISAASRLYKRTPVDNDHRLAGLLIGAEIAAAEGGAQQVTLVASGDAAQLYEAALSACGSKVRLIDEDLAMQRGLLECWLTIDADR